jgi:hypothetical protein
MSTEQADDLTPTTVAEPSPVADELHAMRKLYQAISPLDPASQRRVLMWLFDRYGVGEAA